MEEATPPPAPRRRTVRERWSGLNEWIKAAFIAVLALLFLHFFVLRWVTVRSTSMYATLLPGDVLGVERWPVWTGFHRGDIAVFRDPLQDRSVMGGRQLLVKRIMGLPGDKVELRDGALYVNGERQADVPGGTRSYLVRLKKGTDPAAMLRGIGLPPSYVPMDRTMIELPLNKAMAETIEQRPDVVSAEPMSGAHGSPGHIFPFSPYFKWNSDDYGPVIVPAKGDTVTINAATIPLYDRLISRYEGNKLEAVGNELYINGQETDDYVVRQNYYFVLGDSRHYSADSRYWGFVPADHLVGRAGFVLLSVDSEEGGIRSGRWAKGL
ncbi:MAG: signal peptidase I [Flavobacteriales bacterium]